MHFFKLLFCCHFSTTSASNSLQPRPVELQQDEERRYSSRHPNHAASEYGKSIAFSAAISSDSDSFPAQRSLGTLTVLNTNQSSRYNVGPKYGRAS
ncbi:hypothetical protein BKA60DRAFT_128029 [Fusarium oxysporum]|nr:hypothetical protein BKA60DRAFT_128029 [Fusarium oxysporum]